MKRTLAVAAALAALTLPAVAQTRAGQPQGVEQLASGVARAFEANDPDALAALYDADAVMYPPAAMEQRGRAAIRKGFADLVAQYRVTHFSMSDAKYETAGDLSVGWGHYTIAMAPKSGGPEVRREGRFTTVARRTAGKWLIVSSHASMPQPLVPAAPRGVSAPAR